MQVGDILGDHYALGILPRPLADAVARVDGGLTVGGLGRKISAPGFNSGSIGARGLRQRLALIVGAGETAEIAAIADAGAGQEEAGGSRLRACGVRCKSAGCEEETRGETIFATIRIESSGLFFFGRKRPGTNTACQALFRSRRQPSERKLPERKKRRGTNHGAFYDFLLTISWSAGSPRVPNCRRAAAGRSKPP
jgi:hypothetical protein